MKIIKINNYFLVMRISECDNIHLREVTGMRAVHVSALKFT